MSLFLLPFDLPAQLHLKSNETMKEAKNSLV